jgi:hypothetical protein
MSGKCTGKPRRLVLALMCIWVAGAGALLLVVEYLLGWFVFFSPGWANGSLVSFQTALSVGMAVHFLVLLMTAGVVIGAATALVCTFLGFGWERVGRDHRIWFWFLIGFLLFCGAIYWRCCVWVWEQFPDGYKITEP